MQRHGKRSLALHTLCALMIVMSALTQGMSQPFTYQGFLKESGNPANGNYQMTFRLFSVPSGGTALATVGPVNVAVSNGLFTQELNFGNVWDGSDRYLEIQVGSTTLSPRVKIAHAPYAIRADAAPPVGAAGGDLNGSYPNPTVAGLQGRSVSSTAPASGQVLKWDGSAWTPGTDLQDAFWQASGSNIFYNAGNVGIGTSSPSHALHVQIGTGDRAIYGYHTSNSGTTYGVWGQINSTSGRGVFGYASAPSGTNYGVYGQSDSTTGRGVYGYATATSGVTIGVFGQSNSTTGYGGYFVGRGYFSGNVGIGTVNPAYALDISGDVRWSGTLQGGTVPWARVSGAPNFLTGVATTPRFSGDGTAGSPLELAQQGAATGQVLKWNGSAWAPANDLGDSFWQASGSNIFYNAGNVGIGTNSPSHALHVQTGAGDRAIYGYHTATTGFSYGGWFESPSPDGTGVFGRATATSGTNYGVYGQSASPYGRGVYGWATATSGINYGVYGRSSSPDGTGVYGVATATSGTNIGVYGRSDSPSGYGGYFVGRSYFSGDVGIGTGSPESRLHVIAGSAGTVTADANSVLTLEHNARAYLSLLTPDAVERGILFGQPSSNVAGGIIYNSAATPNGLQFRTNGNTTRMVIDGSGNVGIGLTAPTARLHIRDGNLRVDNGEIQSWGAITLHPDVDNSGDDIVAFVNSAGTEVMRVHSNGNVGIGTSSPLYPLHVQTGTGDRAIYGKNTSTSNGTYGGYFEGGNGGMFGYAPDIGVHGKAYSTSSTSYGGYFESTGPAGYGVYGLASAANTDNYGGYFQSVSTSGTGVRGRSPYRGVVGEAYGTGGVNYGVEGSSLSTSGIGVYGVATASTGTTYGVYGAANSTVGGTGVYGQAPYHGVEGLATSTTGGSNVGVYGRAYSGYGVYGYAPYYGVFGESGNTLSTGFGVYGKTNSGVGYGVYGEEPSGGSGHAVYALGTLAATGTKSFQIDHPLNPETHYLNHFCTEGPEPYNAYRGTVMLDGNGEAWVQLPEYFEAINRDPTITLTPVGAPMPNLHVAVKVQNNRFKIAGGMPGKEVFWRVEAIRNDRWVQRYGYQTEQEKPEEHRGKYLHPELYGQPKEMGIHYHPEPERERPNEVEKPK